MSNFAGTESPEGLERLKRKALVLEAKQIKLGSSVYKMSMYVCVLPVGTGKFPPLVMAVPGNIRVPAKQMTCGCLEHECAEDAVSYRLGRGKAICHLMYN